MKLRLWEREDIESISQIEQICFSDPWSKAAFEEVAFSPFRHCFLVEDGGQVCAYSCLFVLFEDAEVQNIAVSPAARGKGYAKALLREMHEKAKALGAKRCLLEVREGNAPALALYESFGYTRYGLRGKYYADGENAVLMQKDL